MSISVSKISVYKLVMPLFLLSLAGLAPAAAGCPVLLDHQFRPLGDSQPVSLCERYAGKLLLVVNTASFCGFTPQYRGLEALYDRYRGRGLVVLGFPSNDFAQEPGSEAEIKEFCELTYGVEFPMFEKTRVHGAQAHPFYQTLAAAAGGPPRWNFHKYLIDRDGRTVTGFATRVAPDDPRLLEAIEQKL